MSIDIQRLILSYQSNLKYDKEGGHRFAYLKCGGVAQFFQKVWPCGTQVSPPKLFRKEKIETGEGHFRKENMHWFFKY